MTDIVNDQTPLFADDLPQGGARDRPVVWRGGPWQPALLIMALTAVTTAWLLAGAGATQPSLLDSDPELAMLLRFMAGVKAAIALAVLGLTAWRLSHPVSAGVAVTYGAAVALMCAAPGVIWQLAHVGLGAGLFHAGVLLFLAALIGDRDDASRLIGRALRRAGHT